MKSDLPERPSNIACSETSCLKLQSMEKSNLYTVNRNVQGKSQDIPDVNYSQFRNKLINRGNHNSTFQRENNFIVSGNIVIYRTKEINRKKYFICIISLYIFIDDKELEKLKNENKKLLNDFITKDGETVYLRQQLQQIQLRTENEKLEKLRLIEEQANNHRLEIGKIYKEKEKLKTQLELQVSIYFIFLYLFIKSKNNIHYSQNLEIGNLQERCKRLESGNVKLEEPQTLYMNTSFKSKCNTSINR